MGDAISPHVRWLHDAAYEDVTQINLEYVPRSQVQQILALWDDLPPKTGRKEIKSRAAKLAETNTIARYLLRNENPEPIRRILRALTNRWCAFGLRENPYFDLEFWDSHAGFYDKSFRVHPRHCTRFHFFTCGDKAEHDNERFANELLAAFLAGRQWSAIQDNFRKAHGGEIDYLGYVIFRPTMSYNIGRTAIRFDSRGKEEVEGFFGKTLRDVEDRIRLLELEEKGQALLKVTHDCDASILGSRMAIKTAEFMQQDPNLGPCATVSLWVATHATANRFGFNKFNYSTISRQAAGVWRKEREVNVTLDSADVESGLYPSEIQNAIAQTGASPVAFSAREGIATSHESIRMRQEVYAFIESGIPTILCLDPKDEEQEEGHAVVLIGHNLPSYGNPGIREYKQALSFPADREETANGPASHHHLVSTMIPVYYSHDDRYGPFNRLVFLRPSGGEKYPPVRLGGARRKPRDGPSRCDCAIALNGEGGDDGAVADCHRLL